MLKLDIHENDECLFCARLAHGTNGEILHNEVAFGVNLRRDCCCNHDSIRNLRLNVIPNGFNIFERCMLLAFYLFAELSELGFKGVLFLIGHIKKHT